LFCGPTFSRSLLTDAIAVAILPAAIRRAADGGAENFGGHGFVASALGNEGPALRGVAREFGARRTVRGRHFESAHEFLQRLPVNEDAVGFGDARLGQSRRFQPKPRRLRAAAGVQFADDRAQGSARVVTAVAGVTALYEAFPFDDMCFHDFTVLTGVVLVARSHIKTNEFRKRRRV
jgi:hypothetical protein